MSIRFEVEFNEASIRRWFDGLVRDQIPFAIAQALTWTARDARKKLVSDLPSQFTIRKNVTRSKTNFEKATKRNLTALVGHRLDYMRRQAEGDVRRAESSRYVAIPTAAARAITPTGVTMRSKNFPRVFLSKRGKKRHGTFTRSIGGKIAVFRTRKGANKIDPELMFILSPSVKLEKRWPLQDTVEEVVANRWTENARRSFKRAMRSARGR